MTHRNLILAEGMFILLIASLAWSQGYPRPAIFSLAQPGQATGEQPNNASLKWEIQFPLIHVNQQLDRGEQTSVYDPGSNSMIVFGGDLLGSASPMNDVLSLSYANGSSGQFGSNWTTLIPPNQPGSPSPRAGHTAIYDAANNIMTIFAGCIGLGACGVNDVWTLSHANGLGGAPAWTQPATASNAPAARYGNVAAYDPASNRMIVFGGLDNNGNLLSDLWILENANGLGGTPTWVQLAPSGTAPAGKLWLSATYDVTHNIVTIFGGMVSYFGKVTNGVWTLSNANGLGGTPTWTQLIADGAPGSPARRYGHIAVFDPASNRMTVFGGASNTALEFPALNDAWVLSNANGSGGTPAWTRLHPSKSPPAGRFWHTAIYDSGSNNMTVYGGGSDEGTFLSVWILGDANGQ